MTPSGTAILSNPQPCEHIVFPYAEDSQLTEAVALFASAGLLKNEAVLLVVTAPHADGIRRRLELERLHPDVLETTGQLIFEDADDLLSKFMFDGIIDEDKFKNLIGRRIREAKAGDRAVRVFGEMVDLIWKDHLYATERLEELWNAVIAEHGVPLLCAYSLTGTAVLPSSLSELHSRNIA